MSPRILVADDNSLVRKTLRHLLEDAQGFEVVDVENGKQAISKALEFRPDIILLDLVMPVMDGLAAAREISKQLPEIPMILYTMHTSAGLQVEAQKFGVRKVVSKEDSRGLLAEIRQLLATHSSAAPSTTEIPASVLPMMPDPAQPTIEPLAVATCDSRAVSPVENSSDKTSPEVPPE